MKRLVLVEDAPWRAKEILMKLKQEGVEIEKILFFTTEENVPEIFEELNSQLEEALGIQIDRIGTGTLDFYNKLDLYYEKDDIFIIIDLNLDDANTFEERINVKYANSKPNSGRGKIWFYTTGGKDLKSMLVQNFKDQLIDVISFLNNQLSWDTEKILKIARGE
ncbi:MAG: hypothetical protein HDR71_02160 [Lachnospiraceae bacterium]|nr:hypothetical protein [Lachnospiraceae bacterium]